MEKTHEERGYNGWSNYETWAVSLWLDNEESSYLYWREQAARHHQDAPDSSEVLRGIVNAKQKARYNLAKQLKEEVTGASPLCEASMYADLLGAALSEVDWLEIVDHWLSE
ncbi:MAG: hypothetical protein A49_17880 [Methyloceanibacter sp.]|nr:MAG: hypothetical protein A49_17880 [Methyloceanibacter sp.]